MNADRLPDADELPDAGTPRSRAEELLAAPFAWDLSPSRRLHHKEVLMQRIDRDTAPAPSTPAPATAAPHRRRLPRPALLLPAASAVLAGALALTLTGGGHGSAPATGAATTTAPANGATVTLDRIAAAAMETDATPVKDSQFVYVRSLVRDNTGTFDGPVRLGAAHQREVWSSQNPRPVARTGWIRETGKDAVMPGQVIPVESAGPVPVGVDRPTYKWLAALPTDPDDLLRLLQARTRVTEGESRDQAVFEAVGELLRSTIMPPANASALYKAVERIPGVTVIPDAVDAAGRHGIGITRVDPSSATRSEWIFDRHTLAYLGSRSYLKDRARGVTADTLFGVDAVLQRAVTDRHGEAPARTAG
ncbi:CU044_5270 family protein [Streptomyces sp. NPDC003374]